MGGRKSELKECWNAAEEGEAVGHASSSKGVREIEKGNVMGARDDGGGFERGGRLVGVDFDEANEAFCTGCEGILRNDFVGGELRDGCFESGEGLFAEGCGQRLSKGRGMGRGAVGDGVKEGVFAVSTNGLLLEDVCWIFEEEDRREAVLGVCGGKGSEACRADVLVEKRCVTVETLCGRENGVFK